MTYSMCSKTLIKCHCETGNIWSHLLSALYFMYHLILLLNVKTSSEQKESSHNPYSKFKTNDSKITQIIGCLAIIFTMTASSFYHLFNAMSKYHNDLFLKIDMMGIGIMIFSLTLVLVSAGFYAH